MCRASRELVIFSKGDPENSPGYSEVLDLCGNHRLCAGRQAGMIAPSTVCSGSRWCKMFVSPRADLHTVRGGFTVLCGSMTSRMSVRGSGRGLDACRGSCGVPKT